MIAVCPLDGELSVANRICGCRRERAYRSHGMSACGDATERTPIAPAAPSASAPAARAAARAGPGIPPGAAPARTTATLPLRSRPFRSSYPCSGEHQPVPDEDERGVHRPGRGAPEVDRRVGAEGEGLRLASADQGETGAGLVDPPDPEPHRLEPAIGSRRLEPRPLEHRGHVLGGFPVLRAAGLPAAHGVVGERRHVPPPRLRLAERGGWESNGEESGGEQVTGHREPIIRCRVPPGSAAPAVAR